MRSSHAGWEILPLVMPALRKQRKSWDGRQNTISKTCAEIPGTGSPRIPMDTRTKKEKKLYNNWKCKRGIPVKGYPSFVA